MSSIKPLLLHAHSGGPNPVKIAAALEYLGVPYEVKLWNFGPDPNNGVKGEAFVKINPNGRVPAIEDPNTGVTAWESGAVMNYLRRVYDKENKLGPRGTTEQDIVDFEKWEYFLLSTLGPMGGQANWFRAFHPTKNEDALKRYIEQTERCLGVLEGQLAKTNAESIIPGGITAVDLHTFPWIRSVQHLAKVPVDPYPNVLKWYTKLNEEKAIQDGISRIQSAPKP